MNNSINSKDALRVAFKNKFKRWVPAVEKEVDDPCNAMSRFLQKDKYFYVNPSTSFKIKKTDKVFTIGSCFARNVERALIENNVDLIGKDFAVDASLMHQSVGAMGNRVNARSALNKYSTLSICEEFERVINKKDVLDNGFIELTENGWIDPQLASVIKPLPYDELVVLRERVDDLLLGILEADIIFITLGLNEVWYDKQTGCYLNSSPPPALMRTNGDRFVFSTPSYNDVYNGLKSFVDLIIAKSNKNVKFVVTVSPVPLSTTWTGSDIVIANTTSKSALRVCAEQLSSEFSNIDYFPSFEIVTNSPRELAWQDDQLHVKKEMVDFVISNFMESYFE